MHVFINELSLDGQIPSREAMHDLFKSLMLLRRRSRLVAESILCSRNLAVARVIGDETVREVIATLGRDERIAILQWITSRGPFIEDNLTEEKDNLFTFSDKDVTYLGLGEAARRVKASIPAATFSFVPGSVYNFATSPLRVMHGFEGLIYGTYNIPNFWTFEALQHAIETGPPHPTSWNEMLKYADKRFTRLSIGMDTETVLRRQPFSRSLCSNVLQLLSVLDEIRRCADPGGALNEAGEQLRQKYFVGRLAWFSDESEDNKRNFRSDMTFKDPNEPNESLTCFWHGKIQTPQFRIHFEWPIKGETIKVPYIGPKISKK